MLSLFFHPRQRTRRQRIRQQACRRFFRPRGEMLESRDLLAFNLTISPAATNAAVTVGFVAGTNTTTFKSNAGGANVSINDIASALALHHVLIETGGSPLTEAGNISTNGITEFNFDNMAGATLTIKNGTTGVLSSQADVTLTGLQMTKQGTLIVEANQNTTLIGELSAGTMSITAGSGPISMPNGGELSATTLSLTAGGDIGTTALPVLTSVSQLTTDTSANNTSQFITEANGLAAIDLNAGTGTITLNVTTGAVSDTDAAVDIAAGGSNLALLDSTAKDFGSVANPIGTSVNILGVFTPFGDGNQFIRQSKGLSALNILAGGNLTLTVSAGGVADTDSAEDIKAASATITLGDPTVKDFGSAADPIETRVEALSVNTSAGGGDQFITEEFSLTALNLNAGSGDVALKVKIGTVTDGDAAADITANVAVIELGQAAPKDFGAAANPIHTSVNSLTVETSAGGGSQFITESAGLTALQLFAASGNVTLTVSTGSVADTDATNDIFAAAATVTLSDPTAKDFGATPNPIRTSVDSLSVNTSVGHGNQFITEDDGLTALNLVLGPANVVLTLTAGAVLDTDQALDIVAFAVSVSLLDASAKDFGAATNPIGLSAATLVATTASGGSQFITVPNSLTSLQLDAGAGNITLTVTSGGVADTDSATPDITAATANVTIAGNGTFGTQANPMNTSVNTLSVNTTAGNGNQFISEANSTAVTRLDAGSGSITLVSGTFNLVAGDAIQDTSALIVNSPAILNLASSSETIGGLAGSGTVAFKQNGSIGGLNVGFNNLSTTFSGAFTGNDTFAGLPTDFVQKFGSGTLTLSGDNSFTGAYLVSEGKLLVTGTIGASTALMNTADSGGTIGGTGTINRLISMFSGGHLAPGISPGVLSTGSLSLGSGSAFDVEITGAAAGQFDQANVTGTVTIGTTGNGVALNLSKVGTLNLANGQELVIINNNLADAITGTFKDVPKVAGGFNLGSNFLGSGLTAKLLYDGGDGNDVSIKLTPGSLFPWHNDTANKANDVRGTTSIVPDGHVFADDALAIINFINANGAGPVPASAVLGLPFGFLDTQKDNQILAGDVLAVINFINSGLGGEGEGQMDGAEVADATSNTPLSTPLPYSSELLLLLAIDLASQPAPRRRG